jgi:hypothetical protein
MYNFFSAGNFIFLAVVRNFIYNWINWSIEVSSIWSIFCTNPVSISWLFPACFQCQYNDDKYEHVVDLWSYTCFIFPIFWNQWSTVMVISSSSLSCVIITELTWHCLKWLHYSVGVAAMYH